MLLGVSVYTVFALPLDEAIRLWRGQGNVLDRQPRLAQPAWFNLFREPDLPPTITFDSRDEDAGKQVTALENGWIDVSIPFTFDYDYGAVPQEIVVDLEADYMERGPHVTLTWVWPDGQEQELTGFKPTPQDSYFVSRDSRLMRRLDSENPLEALFPDMLDASADPGAGAYTLRIDALLFEPGTDVEASVTMIGQVHGLAGTDAQRRDLGIALLWGTPVALGFGVIAAIATSVGSMLIAAVSAWYGGAIDRVVQFLTEVVLILPFFPLSLMIFVLYSRSILTILAVTVLLTLFGTSVKSYRATFLQVRASPYIEAARAYGASDWRIVVRYMVPRSLTMLIPRIIILVPAYVFLEATLAFLGVSDPVLPTWGKLVVSALSAVQSGNVYLIWVPLGMLFLTGLAFAMVGLTLEDIFEPRRRKV
jgi:peptide/nickel transport system permease protein